MRRKLLSCLMLTSFLWGSSAQAATYAVDTDHSAVTFKIRHLLTKTQGRFNKFQGTIEYEPGKPETWSASGTIDAASIDTNVPERDKHLRSADFFDVEKYPEISFKTVRVVEAAEDRAKVEGLITIHGVERPILLDVEILGVAKDPWGNTSAAFTVTGRLDRRDFGLTWHKAVEAGTLVVGNEVDITLEIAALLQ